MGYRRFKNKKTDTSLPVGVPNYSKINTLINKRITEREFEYHETEALEVDTVILNEVGNRGSVKGKFLNSGKSSGIVKPLKFNKTAVEQLLKSAVGHGFHMVHKMDAGPIKHFQATPQYMREASTIKGGLTIWYGGKTSAFSRSVQIEMETAHYRRIQLVIRNKAGAHGPPKDLLANYYYR